MGSAKTCDLSLKHARGLHEADRAVQVVIDGVRYVGDLCEPGVDTLKAHLESLGLQPGAVRLRGAKDFRQQFTAASGAKFTTADVRPWALEQNYDVHPSLGMIPKWIRDEYAAVH